MAVETRLSIDSAPASVPAISVRDLSVRLGDRLALSRVSLDVASGAFVGLIGPNGSGKSTLLRAIMGVVPVSEGSIAVGGRTVAEARDRFAYLPQRQRVDLEMPVKAWDVVMMGRIRQTGLFRPLRRQDRDAVDRALDLVGLAGRKRSAIGHMSFGQQQRVFFARALAQEGDIIILDEPMNGVDPQTQELFVDLLHRFHAEGKTIVMATHDLTQAAAMCDNLCVLKQSLIAYGPVAGVLNEDVLSEAYGAHLHFQPGATALGHLLGDVHHHDDEVQPNL